MARNTHRSLNGRPIRKHDYGAMNERGFDQESSSEQDDFDPELDDELRRIAEMHEGESLEQTHHFAFPPLVTSSADGTPAAMRDGSRTPANLGRPPPASSKSVPSRTSHKTTSISLRDELLALQKENEVARLRLEVAALEAKVKQQQQQGRKSSDVKFGTSAKPSRSVQHVPLAETNTLDIRDLRKKANLNQQVDRYLEAAGLDDVMRRTTASHSRFRDDVDVGQNPLEFDVHRGDARRYRRPVDTDYLEDNNPGSNMPKKDGTAGLRSYVHCRLYTLHHSEGLNSLNEILSVLHWSCNGILQRMLLNLTEVWQDLDDADKLNANTVNLSVREPDASWESDCDDATTSLLESENWDDDFVVEPPENHPALGFVAPLSAYQPVNSVGRVRKPVDVNAKRDVPGHNEPIVEGIMKDENENPRVSPPPVCSAGLGFSQAKVSDQTRMDPRPREKCEWDDKPVMGGRKLLVRNISFKVEQHELWEFFKNFGPVKFCEVLKNRDGRSRGIAYVTFRKAEDAARMLKVPDEDLILEDRQMSLCYATRKKRLPQQPVTTLDDGQISDAEGDDCDPSLTSSDRMLDDMGNSHLLNNDVLINIFSRLPLPDVLRLRRVCRHWRQAASLTMQCIHSLDLRDVGSYFRGFKVMDDHSMVSLLQQFAGGPGRTSSLRTLNVSRSSRFLTNDTLHTIASTCPNLTSLDVSGMDIGNHGLMAISGKCINLKYLWLKRCNKIGEDGLWWIFHRCKELQLVDLEDNKRMKGKCLHVIGHQVESINLQGCSKLQTSGLQKIAKQCPSLRSIDISRCMTVAGEGIISLTHGCLKLTSVNLGDLNSNEVTAADLVGLSRLHNLEELYLTWLKSTNDLVLSSVSHGCTKLRVLDITGAGLVTDNGLNSIGMCPSLQKLNISYLQVTDSGLDSIFLAGCLTSLTARGCNSITGGGFVMAVDLCHRLKHLDMSGCFQVYTDDFEAMLIARETVNSTDVLTMIIGSTFIDTSVLEIPPFVHVEEVDLCDYHNITRDLVLRTDFSSDEEEGGDGHGLVIDDEMGGDIAGAGDFDEEFDDFLENDDPLALEDYDLS